ncbi:hypothetical protein FA95DRAFT_1552680 [Auriscalpium vulgare]|uniref:Uncharacterized protein n=1 Tax=Auriscalpium vulgare TaxID=40419 RepID=A0ACB8SA48_9AGAM|nr:hypothetical protein FA95DRAFT_1552680 [Auriscalpium vulgare]
MDIEAMGGADVSMDTVEVFGSGETVIPTEASVAAAKERRETRRKAGASREDDFIPLTVGARGDVYQGPHPESRLVREEDELGEGDDEFAEYTSAKTRIALGKKSRKVEASKRRDEMLELIADAEEVDEETEEWEHEQIRRGGMRPEELSAPAPVKQVYKPAPLPPPTTIPTLDAAVAGLARRMTALTTSHAQNATALTRLSEEQAQLDAREDELRAVITRAETKRAWFASFREWVESVATFLDEKFPQLETLEAEHVSILKERHDMVSLRRQADTEDDLSLFLGTPPAAPHTAPEELDELGRIVPRANPTAARRDRQAARLARRTARRTKTTTTTTEEEGFSTDDELAPSDAADYAAASKSLRGRRDAILADVKAKEFREPSLGIAVRFGEWREKFEESYVGAWGGLGLVGSWEFWVRLEMLGWNPFEDTRSLDSFQWYAALHTYSRPRRTNAEEGGEDEPELGPDGDLVSAMISTAVIPRLAKLIESGALDPFSVRDVRRAVDLAEEIEVSVERSNLKFQILMKAITSAFSAALDALLAAQKPYLAVAVAPFSPDAVPARRRALARQRKLLAGLVRWRRCARGLYGVDALVAALLEEGMVPLAQSGWEVGGEEGVRAAVRMLPKELVPAQLRARIGF